MQLLHKVILIVVALFLLLCMYSQYFLVILRNHACLDKEHILTAIDSGQLGNNIWEYMSLFAIANLYKDKLKLSAYCPDTLKAKMEDVFESLSIPAQSEMPRLCSIIKERYILNLNESLDLNRLGASNYHVILAEWSARYQDVLEYGVTEIKKELKFHAQYVNYTYKILNKIKESFGMEQTDVTFVGMHYRGTDYTPFLKSNYNKYNSPPDYLFYLKAMDHFKQNYRNVIFMFITIDLEWLENNLPFLKKDTNLVVNPDQSDAIKDLALLAHCNHSIINYGTFGATAALFAGGTTFVYDLALPLDQRGPTVAMGIAKILPHWHIL